VEIKSREDWRRGLIRPPGDAICCYTDGSRMLGRTGAGYLIQPPGRPNKERTLPLGRYPTVPQAEVFALLSAARALRTQPGILPINIYSDSLSSLQSLQSAWKQSSLMGECFEALNTLAMERPVTVHWIPAHSGYTGNERVDQIAKRATETEIIAPEPIIPVSVDRIHDAIKKWGRETHLRRWRSGTDCTDTKKILKTFNKQTANYCRSLGRESLRILTMIVTGHCLLALHLHRMGLSESPTCTKCGRAEENRDHFLLECEAYATLRLQYLGQPFLAPEDLVDVPLPSLVKFALKSTRFKIAKEKQGGSLSN
jgi:ribonuclease HI